MLAVKAPPFLQQCKRASNKPRQVDSLFPISHHLQYMDAGYRFSHILMIKQIYVNIVCKFLPTLERSPTNAQEIEITKLKIKSMCHFKWVNDCGLANIAKQGRTPAIL